MIIISLNDKINFLSIAIKDIINLKSDTRT